MVGLLDGIGPGGQDLIQQQPAQQGQFAPGPPPGAEGMPPMLSALANQVAAQQQQIAVMGDMIRQIMDRQMNFEIAFRRDDTGKIVGASLISR